jgi:hypothetical protein
MIHPNLVVYKFTFIFWHFVFYATSSNVHPTPSDFVTNPEPTKLDMKLLFPNIIMAPIILKNSCNSFKMWLKTFKYPCHDKFSFFGFKFCTNLKSKHEKGNIWFFFWRKWSLYLQKLTIMSQHFTICFGLVTIFQMFE